MVGRLLVSPSCTVFYTIHTAPKKNPLSLRGRSESQRSFAERKTTNLFVRCQFAEVGFDRFAVVSWQIAADLLERLLAFGRG